MDKKKKLLLNLSRPAGLYKGKSTTEWIEGESKSVPSAAAAVGAKPPLQMQWSSQATASEAVWKNIYLSAWFNIFVGQENSRRYLVVVLFTVRT